MQTSRSNGLRAALVVCFVLGSATGARCERLPLEAFKSVDGLPHNFVIEIATDSHGFVWFCTRDGLGRFDGYAFVVYGPEHGLPDPVVTDLLEARDGSYWIATPKGICRLDLQSRAPAGGSRATRFVTGETSQQRSTITLHQSRDGRIWAGTVDGLYVLDDPSGAGHFRPVDLQPRWIPSQWMHVEAIAEDAEGILWVGTTWGLFLLHPDGATAHVAVAPTEHGDVVRPIVFARDGTAWIGHAAAGLTAVSPSPLLGEARHLRERARLPAAVTRRYTTADGLGDDRIVALEEGADGTIFVGTVDGGFSTFDGRRFRTFTKAHGLPTSGVVAIAEDGAGNLWLGTEGGGAIRMARNGFVTYGSGDGLASERVGAIFESRRGDLCVVSGLFNFAVGRRDGEVFRSVVPLGTERVARKGWGWNQLAFQDRQGEWWFPTGEGLFQYPAVADVLDLARTPPKAVYTSAHGLPNGEVFRLYEDGGGDVWVSTTLPLVNGVARWDRATETFHPLETEGRLPANACATAFGEDSHGNIWIGFYDGGVARYASGRLTLFEAEDGLPPGRVNDIFLDSRGALWLATSRGGVCRVEGTETERPRFVSIATRTGLCSDMASAVTEDQFGRIYVATSRGVCRFDLESGRADHFDSSHGLAADDMTTAFRDASGTLWFGSDLGLSRLTPIPARPLPPPPVWIDRMLAGGDPLEVAPLGERDVRGLELEAGRNTVEIGFHGITLATGDVLRYQYMLEGLDDEWSELTAQRSIVLAGLAPGSYRFLVRAVNAEGLTSEQPAIVEFLILPPVWMRWWFLLAAAAAVGVLALAFHRFRVRKAVEVERVRTRIATDLHDDIGASLSQIAILTEVIRQRDGNADPELTAHLSRIASVSRELVDSMSDIVWAINPARDHLADVTHRMRRFASDSLASRGIKLVFHEPESSLATRLGADARREVYLIFKEAVNNAARHSDCTKAEIAVDVSASWLTLTVRDDGSGFESPGERPASGNGLLSMRRRAEAIGGELRIDSGASGTTVRLRYPLGGRRRRAFPLM